MKHNPVETLMGALVLITAICFLILGMKSINENQDGAYKITLIFGSTAGLKNGDNVKISGITVGKILDLDLDLDQLTTLSDDTANKTQKNIKQNVHKLKTGILVVEDNPMNQKLITMQLKNIGYHCDVADNGEDGKIKWQSGDYKLIITDCHMPIMDGYEMTRGIRELEAVHNKTAIPILSLIHI